MYKVYGPEGQKVVISTLSEVRKMFDLSYEQTRKVAYSKKPVTIEGNTFFYIA